MTCVPVPSKGMLMCSEYSNFSSLVLNLRKKYSPTCSCAIIKAHDLGFLPICDQT